MSAAIVPVSGSSGLTSLQAVQANRSQRRAEVEVFRHGLAMAVATELDRQDSQAIGDVITTAAEEELRFLDFGMAMAAGSSAKAEMVARKANLMSNLNNQRIARRFGR